MMWSIYRRQCPAPSNLSPRRSKGKNNLRDSLRANRNYKQTLPSIFNFRQGEVFKGCVKCSAVFYNQILQSIWLSLSGDNARGENAQSTLSEYYFLALGGDYVHKLIVPFLQLTKHSIPAFDRMTLWGCLVTDNIDKLSRWLDVNNKFSLRSTIRRPN